MKKDFVYFDDRNVLNFLKSPAGRNTKLPAISIACSIRCNLRCPHCIYDANNPKNVFNKGKKEELSLDKKLRLLEKAHSLGARYLQICHEGEPFVDETTMPLIKAAKNLGIKTFFYTNATNIVPQIAKELYEADVYLGVKCDSLNPAVFNKMIGTEKAEEVYQGIQNLINAGYNKPVERNGKLFTKLCLVCTLTSENTRDMGEIKKVAEFAWKNNLFFGIARLEYGGRAIGETFNKYKVKERKKIEDFVEWCSKQTGIDYWNAQPTPYCIGVCGMQISNNGDVWVTEYGGSCDFTEPDGESFPEKLITLGNVKDKSLEALVERVWLFRKGVFENGILDKKLQEYEETKDLYPNGLQDCGSARTHTLFVPFYEYVEAILREKYGLKKRECVS